MTIQLAKLSDLFDKRGHYKTSNLIDFLIKLSTYKAKPNTEQDESTATPLQDPTSELAQIVEVVEKQFPTTSHVTKMKSVLNSKNVLDEEDMATFVRFIRGYMPKNLAEGLALRAAKVMVDWNDWQLSQPYKGPKKEKAQPKPEPEKEMKEVDVITPDAMPKVSQDVIDIIKSNFHIVESKYPNAPVLAIVKDTVEAWQPLDTKSGRDFVGMALRSLQQTNKAISADEIYKKESELINAINTWNRYCKGIGGIRTEKQQTSIPEGTKIKNLPAAGRRDMAIPLSQLRGIVPDPIDVEEIQSVMGDSAFYEAVKRLREYNEAMKIISKAQTLLMENEDIEDDNYHTLSDDEITKLNDEIANVKDALANGQPEKIKREFDLRGDAVDIKDIENLQAWLSGWIPAKDRDQQYPYEEEGTKTVVEQLAELGQKPGSGDVPSRLLHRTPSGKKPEKEFKLAPESSILTPSTKPEKMNQPELKSTPANKMLETKPEEKKEKIKWDEAERLGMTKTQRQIMRIALDILKRKIDNGDDVSESDRAMEMLAIHDMTFPQIAKELGGKTTEAQVFQRIRKWLDTNSCKWFKKDDDFVMGDLKGIYNKLTS